MIHLAPNRIPFDRPYNYTENGKNYPVATFGTCSYAVDMTLDGDFRKINLLVGRFCSFASRMMLYYGGNHAYRNVVTTYPFGGKDVQEIIHKYVDVDFNMTSSPIQHNSHNQIIIGNDVWIGGYTAIKSGVRIGTGAIIGTNSMVAKDIPPYAIAVGNPARVVKYRFDEAAIKKFMAVKWWNWDIKKILSNTSIMHDVDKFLETHYSPTLNKNQNINGGGADACYSDWKIHF